MEIGTVVRLKDGRKGLIERGSYYGDDNRVSNFWSGRVLDKNGNLTDEKFHGYDNGQSWTTYGGDYVVRKTVEFR